MEPTAGDTRDAGTAWIRAALERFEGPLLLYAQRLLGTGGGGGDPTGARDVVQDVFLRLCTQDRATLEARLGPWLFTVCRNRCLDERRRGRHMERTNVETAVGERGESRPGPELAVEMRETASRALSAVDALPESQQEVVRLKFRHGLSYREISEVTGISVSNVGVRIHEAMKTLRARLGARPDTTLRAAEGGGR